MAGRRAVRHPSVAASSGPTRRALVCGLARVRMTRTATWIRTSSDSGLTLRPASRGQPSAWTSRSRRQFSGLTRPRPAPRALAEAAIVRPGRVASAPMRVMTTSRASRRTIGTGGMRRMVGGATSAPRAEDGEITLATGIPLRAAADARSPPADQVLTRRSASPGRRGGIRRLPCAPAKLAGASSSPI
jgi:hypothetical protein